MHHKPQGHPTLHNGKTAVNRPHLATGNKPDNKPKQKGGCRKCRGGRP